MKYAGAAALMILKESRPARGAWVEIETYAQGATNQQSRAPQGARGLKSHRPDGERNGYGVAPRKGRVG